MIDFPVCPHAANDPDRAAAEVGDDFSAVGVRREFVQHQVSRPMPKLAKAARKRPLLLSDCRPRKTPGRKSIRKGQGSHLICG